MVGARRGRGVGLPVFREQLGPTGGLAWGLGGFRARGRGRGVGLPVFDECIGLAKYLVRREGEGGLVLVS